MSQLWEESTADRRLELLPALLADEDQAVRKETARFFWRVKPLADLRLVELCQTFVEGRAFGEDPTPLLQGLKGVSGPLDGLAEVVLKVAGRFAGALADEARDLGLSIAGDVPTLYGLLLLACEQAHDTGNSALQVACLDAWDALLAAGVGTLREAHQLLDSIDA